MRQEGLNSDDGDGSDGVSNDFVPGEPGSKPFPGFVSSKSDVGANLDLSESPASPASKVAAVEKPAKMIPVKRTRLRSRDNRKIVLKRRKVKRLRARPRKVGSSEGAGLAGLAPEVQRGGALAELALATLSAEELSAELSRDRLPGGGRDIQIMKISKPTNRDSLTFPPRVTVALKKVKPDKKKKLERLNINAIRKNIFDPRKRLKGIEKRFKSRLRSPESEESTTIPSLLQKEAAVSPFPNFPLLQPGNALEHQDERDGRAETGDDGPNIGFEELTLTPGRPVIDLSEETFIPILRPDTKSYQPFPPVNAVPESTRSNTPVKGEPLPISQFFDYGDNQQPEIPNLPEPPLIQENDLENFPKLPLPVAENLPKLPPPVAENFPKLPPPMAENFPKPARPPVSNTGGGVKVGVPRPRLPNVPPFPDIFNSPRPAFTTTSTPQPIFQDPPLPHGCG